MKKKEKISLTHLKAKVAEGSIKCRNNEELAVFWANKYAALVDGILWYYEQGYDLDTLISEWFTDAE